MWEMTISGLLGLLVSGALIAGFLAWLVWRTHDRRFHTPHSTMLGLRGEAVTAIEGTGRVTVRGEYWWARARVPIAAGTEIRVIEIDGMWIEVEPCVAQGVIPRQVSAVLLPDSEN